MSVIVYQFQTVKFIQMMSLTFGLFTQVSGSGPLGPLVYIAPYDKIKHELVNLSSNCDVKSGLRGCWDTIDDYNNLIQHS